MKSEIRTIDLFAGCGGLSLGFASAGFKIVAAVDNWEPAVKTYRRNFTNHDIFNLDLSDVGNSVVELAKFKPDIIVGGPPCQDFSHAGKRNEYGGRADLTVAYAQIISQIKPQWFVMENVDQIAKSNMLVKAKRIFKNAEYGLTQVVLDASLCGVPQKRKRFFLIGKLKTHDDFALDLINDRMATAPMSLRDYFGDALGLDYYYRHPRNYSRRGVFSVDEPSPTIRGVNRPIPKGYPGHPLDGVKDLSTIRPLTTKERAQIQTFPKDFIFEGNKTDVEQQIGNAVPVNLAKFIATIIMEITKNGVPKKSAATLFESEDVAVFA